MTNYKATYRTSSNIRLVERFVCNTGLDAAKTIAYERARKLDARLMSVEEEKA